MGNVSHQGLLNTIYHQYLGLLTEHEQLLLLEERGNISHQGFLHTRSALSWVIPADLLTEQEQLLLEKKGYRSVYCKGPDRQCYLSVDENDFPGFLYSSKETPFHDSSVPRYIQALLLVPFFHQDDVRHDMELDHLPEYRKQKEKAAMEIFRQDIESFPLSPFYERLFKLRGVRVVYDDKLRSRGLAEFPDTIRIGPTTTDFREFERLLLHELYHYVECDIDDMSAAAAFFRDHPKWKFVRRRDKEYCNETHREAAQRTRLHYANLHKIGWRSDEHDAGWDNSADKGVCQYSDQFADFLAILTMATHPEIAEEIMPYYTSVMNTGPQLSLPLWPQRHVWYEGKWASLKVRYDDDKPCGNISPLSSGMQNYQRQ